MTNVDATPRVLAFVAAAALLGLAAVLGFRRTSRRLVPVCLLLLSGLPLLHELWLWGGIIAVPWIHVSSIPAAALALACVAVASFRTRALVIQHPARRLLVELATSTAVLSCALAALDLKVGRRVTKQALILVLDRSRSMELVPDAAGRLRDELRLAELGMRQHDLVGVVGFASGAVLEEPLRTSTSLSSPFVTELARDSTDIEAGLRRALAEVPLDAAARLALLSDGSATTGDAESAAMAAVALGIPIDVVPLEQGPVSNVAVSSVRTAARASEGESIELRVALRSTAPCSVMLDLRLDGELVGTAPAELLPGQGLVRLTQPSPGPGLHRFDVTITGVDHNLDATTGDNSGSAHVRVRGRAAALLLETTPEHAAPMQQALAAAGFETTHGSALTTPTSLSALARYDLVVLSDIPAVDFSPEQLDALGVYVSSLGGGLLLMGGDKSLGPGGYASTPIEAISPVSFDLKQERRRATLTEVIAIDFSGSMSESVGGRTKLDLANEAAVRSLSLLGPGDRLGVAHVDTVVRWTVPVATITGKDEIATRIRAVTPGGGGIAVDTALQASYDALAKEHTQLRHLLLFADGSDAVDRSMAPSLVARAHAAGTTTSVVALGTGADVPGLEHLSQMGHGRFYLVEDATRLPAVFAQETILASRSAITEIPFRPTRLGSPTPLRGVDVSAAPALLGYVVTLPKPVAEVLLSAPDSDPLLAVGRTGLGQVGVFTSDYKGRWGRNWLSWPGATTLFGQLGRWLMRPVADPLVSLRSSTAAGVLQIEATAMNESGHSDNFRQLGAIVVGPSNVPERRHLELMASGLYRTELPSGPPGAYVVSLVDEPSDRQLAVTGVVVDARDELSSAHSDRRLLHRIAELTGGTERDTLAGIFDERRTAVSSFVPLIDPLLVLAALALVLSVAARRLVLPEALLRLWQRLKPAVLFRIFSQPIASASSTVSGATAGPHQGSPLPPSESLHRPRPGAAQQAPTPDFEASPSTQTNTKLPAQQSGSSRVPSANLARQPEAAPRSTLEILLERRRRGRRSN